MILKKVIMNNTETLPASLALCAGNQAVIRGFPIQASVMQNLDVFQLLAWTSSLV